MDHTAKSCMSETATNAKQQQHCRVKSVYALSRVCDACVASQNSEEGPLWDTTHTIGMTHKTISDLSLNRWTKLPNAPNINTTTASVRSGFDGGIRVLWFKFQTGTCGPSFSEGEKNFHHTAKTQSRPKNTTKKRGGKKTRKKQKTKKQKTKLKTKKTRKYGRKGSKIHVFLRSHLER